MCAELPSPALCSVAEDFYLSGSPIRSATTLHELESWETRHGAKYAKQFYYCVGAEIVVLGNIDPRQGLVTGARAKIVELLGPTAFIVQLARPPTHMGSCCVTLHKRKQKMSLGKNVIQRYQFPAILAFSLTFHRFQGHSSKSALDSNLGARTTLCNCLTFCSAGGYALPEPRLRSVETR